MELLYLYLTRPKIVAIPFEMGGHCSRSTESLEVPIRPNIGQIYGHETSSYKSRTKSTMTMSANKILRIFLPQRRRLKNLNSEEISNSAFHQMLLVRSNQNVWVWWHKKSVCIMQRIIYFATRMFSVSPISGLEAVWINSCLLNKRLHCLRTHTLNLA
jgi:hypothetical protein